MTHAWFITGTDTEIGKTFVTAALLHAARRQGLSALGMKPVAAGVDAQGHNEDVLQLLAASQPRLTAADINPYCLQAAIAPHIAAAEEGIHLDFQHIRAAFQRLGTQADCVLVEGVGGFCVPLGSGPDGTPQDSADLAIALGLPVILVVGMRLGCINHALLSAEAITRRGLKLAGWVANRVTPQMLRFAENLATLQQLLPAPLLGVVPYCPSAQPADAADSLHLPTPG